VRVIQKDECLLQTKVRLVDGEATYIISVKDAYAKAKDNGLDLVEMNTDSEYSIVKMLDYGKMMYEKKKKLKQSRKPQKSKEIKFHPNINEHDYSIKLKHIIEFLQKGHVVKISLAYRGREMAHQDIGQQLIDKIVDDTSDYAKVEAPAKLEGRKASMLLTPKKKK
jgi:translation initiation factor IF-3